VPHLPGDSEKSHESPFKDGRSFVKIQIRKYKSQTLPLETNYD